MRPTYTSKKMKRKISKKKFSQKRYKFCGCPGVLRTDFDNINKVLQVNKSKFSKKKSYWKVMPKDSCEVYKERRRRQMEYSHHSSDAENNTKVPNRIEKNKKKSARKTKQIYRSGQRRRHRKQSSSCSCCSGSQTSTSRSTETET